MKILSLNVQGLGHKTKKKWVKELNINHKINFVALQETKMESISHMDINCIWGNSNFQFATSDSVGNSGDILCAWEDSIFKKEYERYGSNFIPSNARAFNQFISSSSLLEVKMEGSSFTWSHPSATKMSKLDRFLVSDGIFLTFPAITAICHDRHLSDHRPIILNEVHTDFGPTSFRIYHSRFKREGFDAMVELAWTSFTHSDPNRLIRFKKKLQDLKKIIRGWIKDLNIPQYGTKQAIIDDLVAIDKKLDSGLASDTLLRERMDLICKLQDINQLEVKDFVQKAKIKWAVEGDENSKFFHDVLYAFGFGPNWCKWIRGIFSSAMASILINGSPTTEFPFFRGLKKGDPLAPLLFILIMESLHISVSKAVNEGVFKGLQLQESVSISHLFYADDVVFIGEWSDDNLVNLIRILNCFHLASGLKINVQESQVLGVGVSRDVVNQDSSETKITWVAWNKTLASKKNGCLGVSSFHALNRALLLKWVRDGYEWQQWLDLLSTLGSITLSSAADRWVCDLNGDGEWVKYIPVKVNVFVWRARLDRLPTRGVKKYIETHYPLLAHFDFFGVRPDTTGLMGFSVIMKCTSAIRQLAYGTSPDALDEYLQMGEHCARDCLIFFTMCIIDLFTVEFLRKPDMNDVQKLYDAHNRIHGLPEMLGSIDCMYWKWINCPKAWHGQFDRGDKIYPSIMLEAVASYNLWIWHAFLGVTCANNDLTVLNHYPLFDDLLDDIALVVPFEVNGVAFQKRYYLADGIYPQWTAFVKSFTVARDERNAIFKRRQESALKDVEIAFCVLQGRWHIIAQPARGWTINKL
nr:hypothetical protein [Tanacetum cinerariifolium]